mgnify:CR=1 FL=1
MNASASASNSSGTNGLAVTSLVAGILAWLFFLALACLNWVVIPAFAIATLGVGTILYACTAIVGCISPIGWIIGAITGNAAKNQIRQTGQSGMGMAQAGFIMSVVGLVFTILTICGLGALLVAGTISLPDLSSYF